MGIMTASPFRVVLWVNAMVRAEWLACGELAAQAGCNALFLSLFTDQTRSIVNNYTNGICESE